jgi:microcystin-dependent protein
MDFIKLFSGGFPLTIERLEFLQSTYTKAISQVTRFAGNGNLIIEGVVKEGDNVSAGVVVIDGEIMEFRAGVYSNTVSIFEETVSVPYNEDANQDAILDEKPADTVRFARCGSGGVSSLLYSSLTKLLSILQQMPKEGDIKMILREYDPAIDLGWALCDGLDGRPNMVNRFPIGVGENVLGAVGGLKEVTLNAGQMPTHTHAGNTSSAGNHRHTFTRENTVGSGSPGAENGTSSFETAETNFAGSHNHSFTTDPKGGNQAHENRPPFLAFNFLIFIGL